MDDDDNNLKTGFEEILKLCCLISTILATTVSVERTLSALKWIKNSTQSQDRIINISLLLIEK